MLKTFSSRMFGVLLLCITVCFSSFSYADEDVVQEIYRVSGLESMVKRFPEMLKEGISANAPSAKDDDGFVAELSGIIEDALDAGALAEGIKGHLKKGLTAQQQNEVKQWLLSPTGSKIVGLETQSMTASSAREMESQVMALQKKYKGTKREQLFQSFDQATNMTESSLDTAMAVQVALAGAFAGGEDGSQPMMSYDQLQQMVEANRFMTRGLIGQQVYTSYLYTYENLSLKEIEEYIAFARTSAGARYFEVLNAAVREVLVAPSREIGRNIMKAAMGKS